MNDLNAIVESAQAAFAQANTPADLENAKALFLGKSGRITELMKGMAALSVDEKKSRGAAINLAKQAIEAALTARRQALADAELQAQLRAESLDVSLPGRQRGQGGLHPVSLTMERIETIFGSMGFDVAQGPEIESDWFNFTALNTPEDHPARSMHDTFYVEGGSETAPNLLRTHTSPMQIRYAVQHVKKYSGKANGGEDHILFSGDMPEIRVIAPGRTYRVDSDATHSPMFHQCEGLWVGENVSFKDLKFVFTDFCRTFFESDDLVLRFRPSFFPFTEPSAEIDIQFQSGPLAGRWLEVAGSGQVHPNVIRNMGLDPEKYIGFAFGMGPDRLTMLRYGVNDLRLFFDGDIRFLSQFQ
ncbi:MAG TPA: phenylalanine--tRNA ligase subunit alpha [Rhodoferax sp.]|jgi:phenylalanyl-tRNA synthetase alpha chain|nr:phenylalanine--tRNA ligase subunit alpha [Rhodoferax sp.]HNV60317.1 phenylalanine--tRNA ligase subunit alpha [Rhodoferax sp.]